MVMHGYIFSEEFIAFFHIKKTRNNWYIWPLLPVNTDEDALILVAPEELWGCDGCSTGSRILKLELWFMCIVHWGYWSVYFLLPHLVSVVEDGSLQGLWMNVSQDTGQDFKLSDKAEQGEADKQIGSLQGGTVRSNWTYKSILHINNVVCPGGVGQKHLFENQEAS